MRSKKSNLSLNDILSSVVKEDDLASFTDFTSTYLKTGIKSSVEMKNRFATMNMTPEALNELAVAAHYIKRMQQKLSMTGTVIKVVPDYDYKLRIVFKLHTIYNINSIPDDVKNNFRYRYRLTELEEDMFKQFSINIPRITYSRPFIRAMSQKYIAGSLDEYALHLEYSPLSMLSDQIDLMHTIVYNLCKESYMNNRKLLTLDKYNQALPYEKVKQMFEIFYQFILKVFEYEANTKYVFNIDMGVVCDRLSREAKISEKLDIINRSERDISTDLIRAFGETVSARTFVNEIMVNKDVLRVMKSITDPIQASHFIDRLKNDVLRHINKAYSGDMIDYLMQGIFNRENVYILPKQTLAATLYKALQHLSDKQTAVINILPVTYTSSTEKTYKNTYEWVKSGKFSDWDAPRRIQNKFLIGDDLYKVDVDACVITIIGLKYKIERVIDGKEF
jgi:hypothetical protein